MQAAMENCFSRGMKDKNGKKALCSAGMWLAAPASLSNGEEGIAFLQIGCKLYLVP